jgi:hypothetical protein
MTDTVTEEHSSVTCTTDSIIRLIAYLAAAFTCYQLKVQRNKEIEGMTKSIRLIA